MPIPEMFSGALIREGGAIASRLLPAVERERYAKEYAEAQPGQPVGPAVRAAVERYALEHGIALPVCDTWTWGAE